MARPKAPRRHCKWPHCRREEYVLKDQLCRAHYERQRPGRGARYPNNPIAVRGAERMKSFGPIRLPVATHQELRRMMRDLSVSDTVIARVIIVETLKDRALVERLLREGLAARDSLVESTRPHSGKA